MPTTPQDHLRPKAETASEPFTFDHADETFTLPPGSAIKAGLLRKFRKLDDLDVAFSILETLCDEPTLAALDDLTVDEFNVVLSDWQRHIGVDTGN